MMSSALIKVQNVFYSYYQQQALCDITFHFEPGSTVALLGANGAGKSTLLLTLNGILKPQQGGLYLQGEPYRYDRLGLQKIRQMVGIVFQNPDDQIFSANVLEDISFGPRNLGLTEKEALARARRYMEALNIIELEDQPTHALSFGQKKKVALAGVLSMQPALLILDEPTAGLDPLGVRDLLEVLKTLQKELSLTILFSTHDMDMVPLLAQEVLVLKQGLLLAQGSCQAIMTNPALLLQAGLRLPLLTELALLLGKDPKEELLPLTLQEGISHFTLRT